MKIICVGRNYRAHAQELNNEVPSEPVIFLKPDSSLLRPGHPFFIPDHLGVINYETELVLRINRNGKHIAPRFAHKYFNEVALGIDFTAREKQSELKSKGLPWELAKAFDGSALVSDFVKTEKLPPFPEIRFSLELNGTEVQSGKASDMLFSVSELISFISRYFTLKMGDLIFTGTPAGVGPVKQYDVLTGYLEGKQMFRCNVR